jgi:hypothetical protein
MVAPAIVLVATGRVLARHRSPPLGTARHRWGRARPLGVDHRSQAGRDASRTRMIAITAITVR